MPASTVGPTSATCRLTAEANALPDTGEALRGKRVIMLHVCLEMGGAERQSLHLARYLQEQCGADVEMWGTRSGGVVARLCSQFGIAWQVVPFEWPASRIGKIRGLSGFAQRLRRASPDVIMPYTVVPNVACGLVWKWTGAARCIWNQRGVLDHHISLRWQAMAARRASCLIANAAHTAASLVEQFRVNKDYVHVVRNGIDLESLDAMGAPIDWRKELGISGKSFVACKLARISTAKDHATVLRAWRRVVDELDYTGPAPVLLLAGRLDDAADAAKSLAFDLELGRSVRFLGHVSDVYGLLRAADLAVFASPAEGCPNGLLESMAAGLAVAATDDPGIREAVGPDNEHFLVPQGDADALAELIIGLARHPDERIAAGRANRQRVARHFSYDRMCQATVDLMAAPEWRKDRRCAE